MSSERVKDSPGDLPAVIAAAGVEAAEQYRAFLKRGTWTEQTRVLYGQRCRRFFLWAEGRGLTLESVTAADVAAFAEESAAARSQQSDKVYLTPVRGLFRYLVESGVLECSPFTSGRTSSRSAAGKEFPNPKTLVEELQALRRKALDALESRYRGDPTFELLKSIERQLDAIQRVQEGRLQGALLRAPGRAPMGGNLVKVVPASIPAAQGGKPLPALVERAGEAGRFAWEEFFDAEHPNPHTRNAYERAVRRFMDWASAQGVELVTISPGMVGRYLAELGGSAAKRNLHLSALRGFFGRLVQRHVVVLNPAATVRGVKEQSIEGKTPEITIEQARKLLASVRTSTTVRDEMGEEVAKPLVVGLRDRAILATLAYTACRAGAIARLRLQDFQHDGTQYVLRFLEKGGKSREIPVRHDLEDFIRAWLDAAEIIGDAKDSPLFRSTLRRTRQLTGKALTTKTICELVKRRLKDAGLPLRLSPHSFRVTAITDLLSQGIPLEDVQYLAGHSEPRTTALYDRRKKKVTRNIVERISI